MRLIDADALNYVRVRIAHEDGTIGGYNAVVPSSEIKNAPTIDAVPVIRCKDCKYCDAMTIFGKTTLYSCTRKNPAVDVLPTDYCSKGGK